MSEQALQETPRVYGNDCLWEDMVSEMIVQNLIPTALKQRRSSINDSLLETVRPPALVIEREDGTEVLRITRTDA